ncbi:hypothetical protein B4U80_10002 [Leptotrombidium deliense]|uniref:Beta-lactamase-related domain-containing protein n=1 Tax=Leptotrombidium deliense TaxID=299467 RepID=A0A443ST16_9ACAR|nr:hypothetical protein B4U80_10002 [Leptotrombidium deliense]
MNSMLRAKAGVAAVVASSSALFLFETCRGKLLAKEAKDVNDVIDVGSVSKTQLLPSTDKLNLKKAVQLSSALIERKREELNAPGIVLGVSWKGHDVWVQGFGFSDLELGVKCNESTVMRIASLSKCITMLLVAKLVEERKINFDDSIYKYLKDEFPEKKWNGEKVDITIRQLASHLAGIRHYSNGSPKQGANVADTEFKEFYIKDHFDTVFDALKIFKDDDLIAKPGTKLNYTTHGYTVLSAVIQKILPNEEKFETYLIKNICRKDLGMNSTYLDEFEPIIYNRSKYYRKLQNGKLVNAPYVDNSLKWAGGGLLSSVPDLLKFANVLLYSYKPHSSGIPGYLRKSTVEALWTPSDHSKIGIRGELSPWTKYGLGFGLIKNAVPKYASCVAPPFQEMIFHSGGAMGATSHLLIVPEHELAVVVICNLGNCPGLGDMVLNVAKNFADNISKVNHDDTIVTI